MDEGFKPIILHRPQQFVLRQDLLFSYCGACHLQLTWRPLGGYRFHANCCGNVYLGEPTDMQLTFYNVLAAPSDKTNVTSIFKNKKLRPAQSLPPRR